MGLALLPEPSPFSRGEDAEEGRGLAVRTGLGPLVKEAGFGPLDVELDGAGLREEGVGLGATRVATSSVEVEERRMIW